MDPISSGASVLAFVTIALQASKTLYEAVSGYRNGPAEVQHLLNAVQDLRGILKQLSRSFSSPDLTKALTDEIATHLVRSFHACGMDIRRFSAKLDKCRTTENTIGILTILNRLRPIAYQQDFEKMRLDILRHLAVLAANQGIVDQFDSRKLSFP